MSLAGCAVATLAQTHQTEQGGVSRPAPLVWRLEINAPGKLNDLLRDYLDIARYQSEAQQAPVPRTASAPASSADASGATSATSSNAAASAIAAIAATPATRQDDEAATAGRSSTLDTGAISRSELRRLVSAAPDQARRLLEAEGYFAADVRVHVDEEAPGMPMLVRLSIDPGPKATIRQVQMVFEGELDTRQSAGQVQAQALVERLASEWVLPKGEAFRQARWSTAKNGALATLRAEGYPTATWSGTSATVDAQTNMVRLFVVADSGPAFSFGSMDIQGLNRQPESAIRNLASFGLGDPYREQLLLDFQERVQKLNLFESVFVSISDDPAQAKAARITVRVRELPLQQATFGVGISSDTGPRVSVEHLHRLLWGYPWQAKSKVQLGRDESVIQSDLTSHPRPGRKRWLASVQFARQLDADKAVTLSQRLRFGQSDEGDRLERTSYIDFQRAQVTSKDRANLSEASAVTGIQQWVWRDTDSPVLPTKGITANVSGGVGHSFATLDASGWFARVYGRLTWYRPLPGSWYATVRGEAGDVLSGESVGVPDTLLFRAGGDESVRGYGYRTLGVKRDGVTLGGKALMTGSVELARPVWSRFPSLWGAVFADAGDAAAQWTDLRLKLGYGVGLRWRSPVGPLRLDLAYGQQVKEFRLHFSVGIAL